jgi:hypothetical protein
MATIGSQFRRAFGLFGALGAGAQPRKVSAFEEAGASGTAIIGGYVDTIERDPRIAGLDNRYRTYGEIIANVSVVAAGLRFLLNLMARPSWSVEAAEGEGIDEDEAKAVAEFVEHCLHDMATPWNRVIRRTGTFRFYGFGVHEWTAKRRADGRIGIQDVEARPQRTIERWDVDEKGSVVGMFQTAAQTNEELYLPRSKVIYLVDDTLTDSPEGLGLLRHLVKPAARLEEYLDIEGRGFERDFRGIPVVKLPLSKMRADVEGGRMSKEAFANVLRKARDLVRMKARKSDTGVLLDSQPYTAETDSGTTISAAAQWMYELLTGDAQGIEHVGAAIERLTWDMARIMGTEALLVGSDGGSRALSEDKSRNLYLTVNSMLTDVRQGMDSDYVGPILRLNGIPEEYWPTLKTEDVAFKSVESITTALRDMAQAGAVLSPDDPAIEDVRDLLGISKPPEEDPEAMLAGLRSGVASGRFVPGAAIGEEGARAGAGTASVGPAADPSDPDATELAKGLPAPRPLYVRRNVVNGADLVRWAKRAGFATTMPAGDLHVTIAYSRTPVDWSAIPECWTQEKDGTVRVRPGGMRQLARLGAGDEAVVLLFASQDLEWRHQAIVAAGASWDHDGYHPHITLSWSAPDLDVETVEPYRGEIVLGPEIFEPIRDNWRAGIVEKERG